MTFPRRAREIAIVAGLLIVPVLVLRANTRSPGDLNFLDRTVLRISAPVQNGLTTAVDSIGRGFSRYIFLVDVKRHNEQLRSENAQLRAELEQARVAQTRVHELDELLRLRRHVPSETLAASVIGVETSSYFRVIRVRLDRGEADVKQGMPVLVHEGVVGRVGRVFGRYCDVVLAVDPKSSIDVAIKSTGGRGILKGLAGENGYRARVDYLLRGEEVKEGDEVVTSGVGGVFPRGLTVGKVSKVIKQDFGLYQEVEVKPAVDFSRLAEVLVVLAAPPPPDPDATPHRAAEPHHGLGVPR